MAACYSFPDISKNETLYKALVFLLQDRFRLDPAFPGTAAGLEAIPFNAGDAKEANLPFVVTTFGMLLKDNYTDPTLGKVGADLTTKPFAGGTVSFARRFVEQVAGAVEEFQGENEMFARVFATLAADGATGTKVIVYAGQTAEVGRRLLEDGKHSDDDQLGLHVNNVLSVVLGDSVQGRASNINVKLPNLDDDTSVDIIKDNVNALAIVYFAAQLEELKFFATADKVMEHFITGMLPLTRGPGGQAIYEYVKDTPNRMTEVERRSLYARAFGFAQGSVDEPLPNLAFQDSWIRFLSAESQYVRLNGNQTIAGPKMVMQGPVVTIEQVFKSAKDLAVNLSLHGYGMAHFAAVELQDLVNKVMAMLSYDDVLKAYGVLNKWQAVERVSQLYLGGSVNGVQKRTMATAGANIIQWLAKNAPVLSSAAANSGVLQQLIVDPFNAPTNKAHPDDFDDIANNVERWLAVTGTVDAAVEKYAEPVSVPTQATIPSLSLQAALPASLQGVLSQVGSGIPGMPAFTNGALPKA